MFRCHSEVSLITYSESLHQSDIRVQTEGRWDGEKRSKDGHWNTRMVKLKKNHGEVEVLKGQRAVIRM